MTTIRSERVVIDGEMRPATIRYEAGRIVAIGAGTADIDFGAHVVLPGLVDSHVHVNEPGRTEWEGFATATRAAVAGGTTTIVDMPLNSVPPTVDVVALEEKQAATLGKLSADTAFWGGLIPGSGEHVDGLADAGVCGFKAFLVDSGVDEFPPMALDELRKVMPKLAKRGLPLLLHAEDPSTLIPLGGPDRSYSAYLLSRPAESEGAAVRHAASLATETGARVHILHVSSGDAAANLGPGMSGETCPHYLVFCAEEISDGATPFKCAPPIRASEQREALWDALREGVLSMVVSDHSPAPASVKAVDTGDFATAWGGIGSLQLRLQATWTGAVERGVDLVELVEWLAVGPARLAGLGDRKGRIAVGMDADFTVFDPDGSYMVRGSALEHRHPVTPYEGMTLRGSVVATLLRGQMVYETGRIAAGLGKMLERHG